MIGGASSCILLLMAVATHKSVIKIEPQQLTLKDGTKVNVRAATGKDVGAVTELIHHAYGYWMDEFGLKLSPQTQSAEKTEKHLVGLGFVATDDAGQVVATFSSDEVKITETPEALDVKFRFANDRVSYTKAENLNTPINGRYLEFKKFATDPSISKQGLGKQLYLMAENYARANGFDGVVLETVYECRWLYEWYLEMGFQVVGKHRYPGSKLDTLILVKRF